MAAESDVLSEIEVLQSIYLDELSVSQKDEGWIVSLVLYPSTAEDCLSQFVRLTLTMDLCSQYPYAAPTISIHNPRGLSDDKLLSLQRSLQMEAESCLGTPVLYQLIERAKEILTESNIPHGNCVICLYGFKEGEVFTKTSCYHYFHSHCLGRYITHSEMELKDREQELEKDKTRKDRTEEEELAVVCPVCREPLTYDLDVLLSSPAPNFTQQEDAATGEEFKKKWAKLQKVLERQKEKGGVIDPEAESNRFLIHINEAPENISETTGTDTSVAESCQSLPSSFPNSTTIPEASQSQRPAGPLQHQSNHDRRQRSDFKRGRRGRGGIARHVTTTPGVEHIGKPSQYSDKMNCVNSGPSNTASQVQSAEQKEPCELGVNTEQLKQPLTDEEEKPISANKVTSSKSICREDVSQLEDVSKDASQTIFQEGQQDREHLGRGLKRGSRGSGRYNGHWHERNFKGPNHWDNSGGVSHRGRGHRVREGGAGHYHRGGGSHRGGGRGLHQRVEKEFRKEGVL